MMIKVTVTKPLQRWQVNDDGILLQGWQIDDNDKSNNNDKSDNIRSVRFEVSHVVCSYDLRFCDYGITIIFLFGVSSDK